MNRKVWKTAALLPLLWGLSLGGCTSDSRGKALPEARPAAPVKVARAERRDVAVQIPAIGRVEPQATVALTPQVDGQLALVHFQEGQWVRRGELLFTIDPRPYEAALRQAEANRRQDQATLENAAVDAARKQQLSQQGFVSAEENDAAQTRLATLRAAVKAGDAAIENARLELQYCSIHSPIDGRIGRQLVHAGNIVKRNETNLAVIHQVRPVHVAFSVREQDLSEIRARQKNAPLAVEAFVSKDDVTPARGELAFVDNAVDPTTGTVLLKALFANDDERLWPGQFVDVRLTLRQDHDAVVVPNAAVLTGQNGQYVFVIGPDATAQVQTVTVGIDLGTEITITSGLSGGEQVVTDGQIRLTGGSKVEIIGSPQTPPSGAGAAPKAG